MFLVKNGKLQKENFQFDLLEGYYLDTSSQTYSENKVTFKDAKGFELMVIYSKFNMPIADDFEYTKNEGEFKVFSEPTKYTINGLTAYFVTYENSNHQFFELQIEPLKKDCDMKMSLLGCVTKDRNIIDIYKSKNMTDFINSFEWIAPNEQEDSK